MTSEKDLVPEEETEEEEESLLREYLDGGEYDYERPQRGDIREGIILRKDANQIIVDIGAKREGIVPETDLEKLGPEAVAELEVGDETPVYVLKPETRDGDVIVSINIARQVAHWDRAKEVMETNEILEQEVTGFNKGGLLVDFGHLQGFVPRSHVVNLDGRTEPGPPHERLRQMVGEKIPLRIIEVDQRQRRLILSERAAWREWRAEQKKHLLADLEVGDIRKGTVTSLADFGAFVDLGGADGLVHLSELSWDRGKKPSDVVQVSDEVEVKVISLDRERQRIGLSLKQLKPNPWETIEDRYAIGQYIDVEITNLADFGAFARLEEGIEGLIHISELATHNIQHPSEVVEPGEKLTIQILSLEPERKRVGLSLRRVPDHLRTPLQAEEVEEEEPEESSLTSQTTDAELTEPMDAPLTQAEEQVVVASENMGSDEPVEEVEGRAQPTADTHSEERRDGSREAGARGTNDGDQPAAETEPSEKAAETAPAAILNGADVVEEEVEVATTT